MASKNQLPTETRVIIPIPEAIERTTNWRNFMKSKTAEADDKMIPKAVYISKQDIMSMAKQCEADESIAGVRAYFTLNDEFSEQFKNEVTFLMVLVRASDVKPFGEDILYIGDDGKVNTVAGNSNVYDYTTPCPDVCDVTSPLFTGIERK
ncbi:hypothetical protein [Mucilaginibacter auburnensis]|uniref:Uncharacterized protein n=1 Tax=Mucilaginibacter auburnensis TaxID=1457233 RepID=A0A2H9VS31_9SPHI|nr:hypothetical protein [Mucilaginibacter auburnensis]PJJ83599.1 hypothetical protein CLV57_0584 [Mucilaginibacter auburnensis]